MSKIPLQPGAFPEHRGERTFFHGGEEAVAAIDPSRIGPDGELLCASASPNVALRYGAVITCVTVTRWTTMSLSTFFENRIFFEDIRALGIGAVIVDGAPEMFDFPVETVFVLDETVAQCGRAGSVETLGLQLDTLPQREPAGPSEPGWDLYVDCVFGGDLTAALTSLGWEIGTHFWKIVAPPDASVRTFIGLVSEDGNGGYLAEHNFCSRVTPYPTLAEALVALDSARRSHLEDRGRLADRARRMAAIDLLDAVHEDADVDYPL